MPPPSTYAEAPLAGMDPVVRCRWTQRITTAATGPYVQRVVPDGCADVIVDDTGAGAVVGPATVVDLPVLAPGSTLRGLRLRPEAIRAVLGVPAVELTDRSFPVDAVVSTRLGRELTRVAADPQTASPRALAWLRDRPVDDRIRRAVRALWASPAAEVSDVSAQAWLSGRHLRRRLLEEVGLGPKLLQRIGRLHRFLTLAEAQGDLGLASLAAAAGYADQAHLAREVRALAATTPRRLVAERAGLLTA